MKRRVCSVWLAVLLLLSMVSAPAFAAADTAGTYQDIANHWGEAAIARWSRQGVLQGYAGQFRPDDPITRGELAVILDRLMDYQVQASQAYPDVEAGSWYEAAVLGAAAAGMLQGDGTAMRPLDPITRQETAVLLGRALGITEDAEQLTAFSDRGEAADWAAGYLGGMVRAGVLSGYSGKLMPTAAITRAEVAQLLNNAISAVYDQAGSYTSDAAGSVIVNAAGVSLTDMTVKGNLIAAEGIGSGDLILDGVTVEGALVVRGGGEHSVIIRGTSKVSTVLVERRNDAVRISVEDDANVDVLWINDGSDAVTVAGSVGNLHVDGSQSTVTVTGSVKTLYVEEQAQGASVTVSGGASVEELTVSAPEAGVTVSGSVASIETGASASNAAITVGSGGKVETVTASGAGTTVSGAGKVETVAANADDVAVSTPNTKVEASQGVSGVTAGNKDVAGGASATTPGSTSGGSSGGSSSGGGSSVTYYTVTYRFQDELLGTEQVASGGHPTGSGITVPNWTGFDFSGWRVEDGWPPVELSDVTVTGDVTLYARLCAMPAERVPAANAGITIEDTDPETFLNRVSGNLTNVVDGSYVLTVQMKAPEGVQYNPDDDVLQISHILGGEIVSVESYTYEEAFGEDGVFTYDYPVAPVGAASSDWVLELYVKWQGFGTDDPCLGGWAVDLDMSGLTLGTNTAQAVVFIDGAGYATLEDALETIPQDSEGELHIVGDLTLTNDVEIPAGWTLGLEEGAVLTIPQNLSLSAGGFMVYGTVSGQGTLYNTDSLWNRGSITCQVVNQTPEGRDYGTEYYQYAKWNGSAWTLEALPPITNVGEGTGVYASFNFEEDLGGSADVLGKAIDCVNAVTDAAYDVYFLEIRCNLTVSDSLVIPEKVSLALMGGEGRSITVAGGGSISGSSVEIITFEGYPPAVLTIQDGGSVFSDLYITGAKDQCLVVEDGGTFTGAVFLRDTQYDEYLPDSSEEQA